MKIIAKNRANLNFMRPVRMKLRYKFTKFPHIQRLAHFAHEVQVIVQVMDAGGMGL